MKGHCTQYNSTDHWEWEGRPRPAQGERELPRCSPLDLAKWASPHHTCRPRSPLTPHFGEPQTGLTAQGPWDGRE